MPEHNEFRTERDSMGEVSVPSWALWGAQTQRAVENFQISGIRFPREFIAALGRIKCAAAEVNAELGRLDSSRAGAIVQACDAVIKGALDDHFPLDIFQTGSGTSTNMNANEVIARRAEALLRESGNALAVHPNDHINMGQSSNDVIPTAIHVAAAASARDDLKPALEALIFSIREKCRLWRTALKTGRTHLMDAMPVTFGQEMGGWLATLERDEREIAHAAEGLLELAIGGTAVGTGVNTHPEFGARVAARLARAESLPLREAANHFAAQSTMSAATAMSGAMRVLATDLIKILNDLRWMNSGPLAGLGEITLPESQPGSSVMPGKVNPVIPEAALMVCMEVVGADGIIGAANAAGAFQLNTALPLVAHHLLKSIQLLAAAARLLAERAITGMTLNESRVAAPLERNPILATALAPEIGYDRAAAIAKRAFKEGRPIRDVAAEELGWTPERLAGTLDPRRLTRPSG